MVTLQRIFDDLAYGEFANMAIGNSPTGTLTPDQYPRMVSLINRGLDDIYTRFSLRNKELTLRPSAGVKFYYITSNHAGDPFADTSGDTLVFGDDTFMIGDDIAVMGGAGDTPSEDIYIDTTDMPFEDDLLVVRSAKLVDGTPVSINDSSDPNGLFIPEPGILQYVPLDYSKPLTIMYQATYPDIEMTAGFNPKVINLQIPRFIVPALLAYVASQFFIGKASSATEGANNVSRSFWGIYEARCNQIHKFSLVHKQDNVDTRFEDRGWA